MKAAGTELLYDCKDFSSIGIIGVLKLIPFLRRMGDEFLAQIAIRKPQAVSPGRLRRLQSTSCKRHQKAVSRLPILYFISPQVWGSRPWRINTIAKTVSKMLVIFPFEKALYEDKGVPVRFVGPSTDKKYPCVRRRKNPFRVKPEIRTQSVRPYRLQYFRAVAGRRFRRSFQ
ncbi:unnamed protein product [Sphagnum balticum]